MVRNLATGKTIHMGEAVGVIAAQSIGEPRYSAYTENFPPRGNCRKRFRKSYRLLLREMVS